MKSFISIKDLNVKKLSIHSKRSKENKQIGNIKNLNEFSGNIK